MARENILGDGVGVRFAATDVSGRAALAGTGDGLLVTNPGTNTVYFVLGDASVVAPTPGATAGVPVLPGTSARYALDPHAAYYGEVHAAAICNYGQTGELIIHRVSR